MRNRWWIVVLSMAISVGLVVLPSQAGVRDVLHRGGKNQAQIRSCVQKHAWLAYFQDSQDRLAPVRDTLNTNHDEDWIGLRFSNYEGPRIRLGVLKVINKSAEAEEDSRGGGKIEVPVSGIQEMLTVALYKTKRFDVLEQKRVEEVEKQQTRKDIQELSPSAIVNVGKVLGAQYLVYGTVNEWSPDRSNRNLAPGAFLTAGKKEAEVAITFSLTDVATGQILFTTAERARIGEWNFGVTAQRFGNGTTSQKTPVTYAVMACANKAALKIATFLRDRKWKGSVVDIKKDGIYINAGSQQGMAMQARLSVLAVRGIVKDQETRTILGEDLRGIGTLEVIAVQNGFSIARILVGCKGMKKGDRVELATDPVPPPRIPECTALDSSTSL